MSDAPNTVRGEISGTIAGKKIILIPSFKKIKRVEITIGRSIISIAGQFIGGQANLTFDEAANIISIFSKEDIEVEDAGDLVVRAGLAEALGELIGPFLKCVLEGSEPGNQKAKTKKDTSEKVSP